MQETVLNSLIVRIMGDASQYRQTLMQAQAQTKQAAAEVERHASSVGNFGFGMRRYALQAMGALGPLTGVIGLVGSAFRGVKLAADTEQAEIGFEVLLGSVSAAKQRMEELTKFAAETPFNLPEIVRASKLLQTFGGTALATGDSLTMVGDMASAANAPFQEVAMWVGRAYTAIQSGRPFGEAGMRLQELGLLSGEARNRMEDLQKTGASAAVQWGNFQKTMSKFTGTMQKQSQSLQGLFSTLRDDIDGVLRVIGQDISSMFHLKDLMRGISDAAQNAATALKEMHPALKFLIAAGISMVGLIAVFELFKNVLVFAAPALSSIGGLLGALVNPIVLIGIAAGIALALWINWNNGVNNSIIDIQEQLKYLQGVLMEFGGTAVAAVREWVNNNQELLKTIGAVAIAVAAGIIAFKILSAFISVVVGLMSALGVTQAAQTILWLAWTGVILFAKAAFLVLSVAVGITKVVVWLLNAGLSVTSILLAGIPILIGAVVVAVTAGLIVAALAPLAAAAWGVVQAVKAVMGQLSQLPTASGPIKIVTGIIGEWVSALRVAFDVMRYDSKLAWDIVSMTGKLAVSQLKDLWPPLWDFIKAGFLALWPVVTTTFTLEFRVAMARMKYEFMSTFEGMFGYSRRQVIAAQVNWQNAVIAAVGGKAEAADTAAKKLQDALKAFNESFKESPETEAIRKALDALIEKANKVLGPLGQVQRAGNAVMEAVIGAAPAAGEAAGQAMTGGIAKEMHKFDAAKAFSAESFARIAEYRDMVLDATFGTGPKHGAGHGRPGAGGGVQGRQFNAGNLPLFEPNQPNAPKVAEDKQDRTNELLAALVEQGKNRDVIEVQDLDLG